MTGPGDGGRGRIRSLRGVRLVPTALSGSFSLDAMAGYCDGYI